MSQKLAELEKKEKELDRQRKQLNDKEQILKQLDTEVTFYSAIHSIKFKASIICGYPNFIDWCYMILLGV